MITPARRILILALAALAWAPARDAFGTQFLVGPGKKWEELVSRAKPGDEILLMPGEHKAALLEDLIGTADAPIVIRSFNPSEPVTIEAGNYGLRLLRCRHIVLQDVIITGAVINGVLVDAREGVAPETPEPGVEPLVHNITFRNVQVLRTGPRGLRHGIELVGVRGVQILDCLIEGWAGSGLELIGCDDVTVEGSTLRGLDGFTQSSGIRMRAGSANILVLESTFENCGLTAICVGGASAVKDFNTASLRGATIGSLFEAHDVRIERNTIVGGSSAITFTHSERTQVRRNTIVDPGYYVFCLLQTSDFELVGPARRNTFAANLITWQPESLAAYYLIDEGVDRVTLRVDRNLWWSMEPLDTRSRLGEIPHDPRMPQIYDVNPELDDAYRPLNVEANGYGANAVKIIRKEDSTP